ncbi:MAG: nickel-dependent lactate racemase [Clostridia bacterium]|nr:nickel-dependent lactate racemase [Clostridia bacterium]
MRIKLAYGKAGFDCDVPDRNVTVVEPVFTPGLHNPESAIVESLRNPIGVGPLQSLVDSSDAVAIVFCDATRPAPNRTILPLILAELALAGVARDRIVLVNALGTHRTSPHRELVEMLGEEIVEDYRIVQHDCHDQAGMALAGTLRSGREVRVNREYLNASVRILVGFIEPHFFAGFSGGGKLVLPGVASMENVMDAHGYGIIADPRSTWGITHGNPVFELVTEAAELTKPTFIVNVTLNRYKEITGVFAGALRQAHAAGIEYVRESAMRAVPHEFDIVITTNSGYPLDRNLYQTVKGMSAAVGIVRDGGAIIAAAECIDGAPKGSPYQQLLAMARTPEGAMRLISSPGFTMPDQWQVQLQARTQLRAKIYLHTAGLSEDEIRAAMLIPCVSIEHTLHELLTEYGPDARICVLPEGPQTIPYVDQLLGS